MEYKLSPDKEKETPPVPIKTYQWEDMRKARETGAYPWTHLLKPPLEGEITAEDILRETTPRRSMSREFSKSRTHSPVDKESQMILDLDSSPGSSRRHGEGGEDEGVHVPKFSKEVSLESENDAFNHAVNTYLVRPDSQASSHLTTPVEIPKNISPKGILKRRNQDSQYYGITETREKTKCCHPLVNKIKHLADKTLHKLEKNENEKSPQLKKKKNNDAVQEIRQLKSSPGAIRRQKFSAIKLGDSDEMSKSMNTDTPPPRKKKEHIYEDIEEAKGESEKSLHFTNMTENEKADKNMDQSSLSLKESESLLEKKSNASQDPSLITEEAVILKPQDHIMEKLHKVDDIDKEAIMLDEEMDPEEPNVDDIFQNQLDETRPKSESPNITITEILDESNENIAEHNDTIPIESSPSPTPSPQTGHTHDSEDNKEWSKPSSDHEYEIIEKPSSNILYNIKSDQDEPKKIDDELSSTTSLERKYLQHTSDEEETGLEHKENIQEERNHDYLVAEELQKNIEDRYFLNTPSTVSRTECEISTSQVDSSALENLPLKRDSRPKIGESLDMKIQQRLKEGTGKLKNQADKLKTKLQNIKTKQFLMPDRPKFSLPDRPKFKMPERPKLSFPERPKFSLPDKRKFSLPDRPKFKKINISDKFSLGDRKKFTLPDRPKFNVPDLSKFKMPNAPKINFPTLGKKKEYQIETDSTGGNAESNQDSVEFESTTFPRLFSRKKKSEIPKTSSSPTLNREDTPPPTFTFTRVKKANLENTSFSPLTPEEPREYGNINDEPRYENETTDNKNFDTTYDFDKLGLEYTEDEHETLNFDNSQNSTSVPELSNANQQYSHVINEINNDEFFVRPKGISRENIQVREYLSDEIRQAFKIPKNALAMMGNQPGLDDDHMYANEPEADPDLMMDDNDNTNIGYSQEDLNERDDGYYTFPPVRPSRAKRKKTAIEPEPVPYIDESINVSMQFSEIDLGMEEQDREEEMRDIIRNQQIIQPEIDYVHRYENDTNDYPDSIPIQSQTLPMPPKRKRKTYKKEPQYSSLHDLKSTSQPQPWVETSEPKDDIIVYRTEHEYIVPPPETYITDQSPVPPTRTRSQNSRTTSFCDDDRTSQGAESLTLDTHIIHTEDIDIEREIRHESPGYATVDKTSHAPPPRRSRSKTPPARRRKSNSSERKYYTVAHSKPLPDRPPRKKSSTSLVTLDNLIKRSVSADLTQYVEIDESPVEEIHKDLKSGEILSKMKDRPLPPPPRPPRGSKRRKRDTRKIEYPNDQNIIETAADITINQDAPHEKMEEVVEIEVSTQTDPLPDDVDFELGLEENIDMSISSSLRDIVDEEPMLSHSLSRQIESPRSSRPTSRSEKSIKLSDPKISELSKSHILGRTSPTVILVERRVSSPTKINEREEILTEASLTVQHIDVDESQLPDVPPLPQPRRTSGAAKGSKGNINHNTEEKALERVTDTSRDIKLDNLITQRLQVRDLDVGRLNVSELQASKILVSDIEGMTLQVAELDSKSGHISVSGIEFSQTIIDEIVKKFTEISTCSGTENVTQPSSEVPVRPVSREEQTQTDQPMAEDIKSTTDVIGQSTSAPISPPPTLNQTEEGATPPQRPPPPDLTPLLYSYLQDMTAPSSSLYHTRVLRERPFTEFFEAQQQSPPPPTRRTKRKPAAAPNSGSSSDDEMVRPSPRRMPPPVKAHEPTVTEAGAQFLRVCHNSFNRIMRNMFNSFMSYISGAEDKKDIQMALVIFLVLIAGLIMFGLSDNRTIHHHHWEFFNPPDGEK